MVLSELLDSVGLTKIELAGLLGVSRKTVTRMKEDVSNEVLGCIEKYKAEMSVEGSESIPIPAPVADKDVPISDIKHKDAMKCSEDEIRAIWKRRGVESDYDIAHSMGVDVFVFRRDYIDLQVARFAR